MPPDNICFQLFPPRPRVCSHQSNDACLCACSSPPAMPVTSQLLRCLPRAKLLACSLLPCQQHHSTSRWSSSRGWPRHLQARSYHSTPPLQSYILTPPQVNSILKANEYSFKVRTLVCARKINHSFHACHLSFFKSKVLTLQVPEFDGKNLSSVLGFESNHLPANAPIEDRRSAATCLQTRGMLLGVFDGHAGCACAQVGEGRVQFKVI